MTTMAQAQTTTTYHEYFCEICNYHFTLNDDESNYCPRCGAHAKRLSY